MLSDAKLLIFDLDGTLYEGTSHFDYYADRIKEIIPKENKELFMADYKATTTGNHPLRIGTIYDAKYQYILSVCPMTFVVTDVHNWQGEQVDKEKQQALYPDPVKIDNVKRMIGVGDGWFLPVAIAVHYGARDFYHCYDETKAYMTSGKFPLPKTNGLSEAMKKLRETKKLVLMTNADAPDTKNLLAMLGMTGLFDYEITDAKKPMKTKEHLKYITEKFQVNLEEIISIGDNFQNDIAPALKMNMGAIYLYNSFGKIAYEHEKLMTVPTLEGLFE